ncbi:hypothetical protein ACGVWS_03245 [Enterobacteriaceae bacterium LUAb1]
MMKKIYLATNDDSTGVTYRPGTTAAGSVKEGTCAAQALLVLKNFRTMRPLLTKPDPMQALLLQARLEMLPGNIIERIRQIITMTGLRLVGKSAPWSDWHDLLGYIVTHAGLYLVGTYDHAVAMVNQPSGLYFFDANDGLFECGHPQSPVFTEAVISHMTQYDTGIHSRTGAKIIALTRVR